ncbi:fimbrillin family protein [Myroides odoratimimus]|uniref:fimbrillin family protein n=1 Tax=Myroides odoratimimus TaxID=76832 RepID=UPI003100F255
MKTKILYSVLLVLLFWSCDNKEDRDILEQGNQPIEFKLGFTTEEKALSRMETALDFTSSWQVGDKVGAYIVKGNKKLQPKDNYVDNLKLEYDGLKWIPSKPIYYPNDGESLHFYAYYPYTDKADVDPTSLLFSVKEDQQGHGYNESDLLTASKKDVQKSSSLAVELLFSHAMALVQIEVEKEEFVPDFTDDFVVRMIFNQTDTELNLETGELINTPNRYKDIIMHKVDNQSQIYRALVPAQRLTLYSKIKLTQSTEGAIIDMDYLGLINKTLYKGSVTKIKLTLGREDGFELLQQYKVGDYYPDPNVVYENKVAISGIPAKGIVFWVRPNTKGTHGLVVSLDEDRKIWNKVNTNTLATDIYNGMENMYIIQQHIADNQLTWSDFPVFEWIHTEKNGGTARYDKDLLNVWYLPAQLELKKLYAGFSGKTYEDITGWGSNTRMPGYNDKTVITSQNNFNNKLIEANGKKLTIDGLYYRYSSSSEFSIETIWNVFFSNGNTANSGSKTSLIYTTRPILAF